MDDKELHELEPAFRAAKLIGKYLRDELLDHEQMELDSWIEQSPENRKLFSEMTNPDHLNESLDRLMNTNRKRGHTKLIQRIRPNKLGVLFMSPAWKYIAAASVMGAIAISAVLFFKTGTPASEESRETTNVTRPEDILPGGHHAYLRRSDGTLVVLDSLKVGESFVDANVRITKSADGKIVYETINTKPGEVSYNTVITPVGGMQEVELADGSTVFLNARSEIRYPLAFNGNTRDVSILGEAYFDVKKDKSKPFNVKVANNINVMVTGTQFNVKAYNDEANVTSTLFEGAITVTSNQMTIKLNPGQAAVVDTVTNQIKFVAKADMESAAAWKNGLFYLDNVDIASLMRQAERWYGIEVEYPYGVPEVQLTGSIDRDTNLGELIKVLNASGVKTRLENRTMIILQ